MQGMLSMCHCLSEPLSRSCTERGCYLFFIFYFFCHFVVAHFTIQQETFTAISKWGFGLVLFFNKGSMHQSMCMDKSASLSTTERTLRSRVNLVQQLKNSSKCKSKCVICTSYGRWLWNAKLVLISRPDNNPPVACLDVRLLRLCPVNKPPRELVGLLLDPF